MKTLADNNLTILAEYGSVMEAEMDKSLLASVGIAAEIENEYMSSLYPTGAIPAVLLVSEHDLARARTILDRH